jgi:hypothetical protein
MFVLIDCLADSGVAEMYTADEHKMEVSLQQKEVSVLHHWEIKSVIQVQICYCWEYGEQVLGKQLEQFQKTGSVLHKKGTGRTSVDTDTVGVVHETFKCSTVMTQLQPSALYQQDGVPPHWALQ